MKRTVHAVLCAYCGVKSASWCEAANGQCAADEGRRAGDLLVTICACCSIWLAYHVYAKQSALLMSSCGSCRPLPLCRPEGSQLHPGLSRPQTPPILRSLSEEPDEELDEKTSMQLGGSFQSMSLAPQDPF